MPADPVGHLLDSLNGWLSSTASPGVPVVARLSVETVSGAALFAKVSEAQVKKLGHMLAVDCAVSAAQRASVRGDGHAD
ncbi:hypothetical protein [Streptomyces sp. NPDC051173]|uniref:hypothetical protein n=1 Tax=Streptomyces sp. NPDC051173 TaxID=3155164 RepID=UPI00344E8902